MVKAKKLLSTHLGCDVRYVLWASWLYWLNGAS